MDTNLKLDNITALLKEQIVVKDKQIAGLIDLTQRLIHENLKLSNSNSTSIVVNDTVEYNSDTRVDSGFNSYSGTRASTITFKDFHTTSVAVLSTPDVLPTPAIDNISATSLDNDNTLISEPSITTTTVTDTVTVTENTNTGEVLITETTETTETVSS